MSDQLDAHIGSLTLGTDVGSEQEQYGTFEGGDTLVNEIQSIEDRAVPDSVIDEQAEVFAETAGETVGDDQGGEDDGGAPDYKSLYEAEQRSSGGKLGEINRLRDKLDTATNGIEELRKIFLAREEAEAEWQREQDLADELEEERRLYGDEVVDDPGVSYMRDKMVQTQQMIEDQQAQQAEYRDRIAAEANAQRATQQRFQQEVGAVKYHEDAFAEQNPDYFDAYEYSRAKQIEMFVNRGYHPQQAEVFVDQQEEGIRKEQFGRPGGGNVAAAVYEMAKLFGWKPSMAEREEASTPKAPKPNQQTSTPNFGKMRAGLGSRGSGDLRGSGGNHDGARTVSAEEFFNTVPTAQRLEILADPDKFEELGRTGQIKMY
jgi:hypothetical protein